MRPASGAADRDRDPGAERPSSSSPWPRIPARSGSQAATAFPPEAGPEVLRVPLPGLTFLGHATVLIELGGLRILTDPILVDRLMFLAWWSARSTRPSTPTVDLVLLSHLHVDHFDRLSLARLTSEPEIVTGPGAVGLARGWGWSRERSCSPASRIRSVRADHGHAGRAPRLPPAVRPRGTAVGYLIESGQARLYFAGDTDLFPEMAIDDPRRAGRRPAPIGGWGPRLGSGHDPSSAAEAAARPRATVRGAHPLGNALAIRPGSVSPPAGSKVPRRSSSAASKSGSAQPVPDPDRPSRRAGTLRSLTDPAPVSR